MCRNERIREDIVRITRFITICVGALIAMAIAPALAMAAPGSIVDDDLAGGTSDDNAIVCSPGPSTSNRRSARGLDRQPVDRWRDRERECRRPGGRRRTRRPDDHVLAPRTLTFTATFETEALENVGFDVATTTAGLGNVQHGRRTGARAWALRADERGRNTDRPAARQRSTQHRPGGPAQLQDRVGRDGSSVLRRQRSRFDADRDTPGESPACSPVISTLTAPAHGRGRQPRADSVGHVHLAGLRGRAAHYLVGRADRRGHARRCDVRDPHR